MYKVLIGAHDKENPGNNTRDIFASKIIVHPLYNPVTTKKAYDIALIKLIVI
jgi:hypothetical protein